MKEKQHKSGFIAVIGRPNVGKSTLINSLIGQKIAIMSDKPQTTRKRILCILTRPEAQIVFLDTPGIHKPKHKLGEYMVKAAEGTLKEVDAIFFVVDATEKMGPGEYYILERLQATAKPVILVVNKLDLIEKEQVLPIISHYTDKYPFVGVVPISAKEETNLDALIEEVEKYLAKLPRLKRVSMCDCGLTEDEMGELFDAHPDIKFIWWLEFGHYRLRTDATAFTTALGAGTQYPYDDDTRPPRVTWRAHANLLYSNWLNYFVYQNTPYDLNEIR